MKSTLILLLIFLPGLIFAQGKQFPEKNGMVIYEGSVNVPGKSKSQLYASAEQWVKSTFKENDIALLQPKESEQVAGKFIIHSSPAATLNNQINSTTHLALQIDLKDQSYDYKITNLLISSPVAGRPLVVSAEDKNLESLGEKKSMYVKSFVTKQITTIDADIKTLTSGLEEFMKK